ncbi:NIPSNAP family protein [Streptomyces sp. NPDC058401]|uniref:NIPSNAP family protein n=1 Tax=Streptomyces sp. NPDC058401 TaxID=3346480 RepID=UPI00366843E3
MFYEVRRYQTRPGRRDDWVRYMETVVLPFQVSKGMQVIASFIDEEDPDGYLWIRRFEDEAHRAQLYEAVYGSTRWRDEIDPAVGELLLREHSVITRAVPTPSSGLR